ncbi:MAG: efflux RND transporter periplasmic adaptor subunit [Firmicutes bacterium]|nr:efflux RND transporter periplasmic adaptor subunit [Bacillota bacterium]
MNIKKQWKVTSLVLLLALIAAGWGFTRLQAAKDQSAATKETEVIRFVKVSKGQIVEAVSALGVMAPEAKLEVRTRYGGKVERVPVEPGATVKAGDLLVKLDPGDAQLKVRQAQTALLQAEAKLAKLEDPTTPQEINQAEAAMRQAEINWESAKTDLADKQQLFSAGAATKQQLDQASEQARIAELQYTSAREKLAQLKMPSRSEDVQAARAEVEGARAELVDARRQLEETAITAPMTGTVISLNVQPYELVNANSIMATLADLRQMKALVNINEVDIARTRVGQQALVSLDALPGKFFPGKVVQIAEDATVQDNIVTYQVTVELDNARKFLKSGMTADVRILVAKKDDALLVPVEAIQDQGNRAFVKVKAGDKTTLRPVEAGLRNERVVEITSGLKEGEEVAFLLPANSGLNGAEPTRRFYQNGNSMGKLGGNLLPGGGNPQRPRRTSGGGGASRGAGSARGNR